mgnify:CR=1 FL=1
MQVFKFFLIDLAAVRGKGEFNCPRCGTKISPDDETDRNYTVLEAVMKRDNLDKIVLQCNRCRSQIYLTGFSLLDKMKCSRNSQDRDSQI